MMNWAGYVACMGKKRNACRIFLGRPEGKKLLGRPRHRWEDNIKITLRKVRLMVWTEFIWLRTETSGRLL
jgi:hypothetical protein